MDNSAQRKVTKDARGGEGNVDELCEQSVETSPPLHLALLMPVGLDTSARLWSFSHLFSLHSWAGGM